jgi:hypothetical protein
MSFESWTGLRLRAPSARARRILKYLGRIALALALSLGARAGFKSLLEHRPLPRAQLAARANSICAAAEKKFLAFAHSALTTYPPNVGETLIEMTDQETRDLGELKPTAAAAADWHAFLAGIRAHAQEADAGQRGSTDGRSPDHSGRAAARRLGIDCELLNRY